MVLVLSPVSPHTSTLPGDNFENINKEKTALTLFANNFNHLFSLCWREEKVTGMICLGLAFIFLILW